MPYPRIPTPQEWAQLSALFPNLVQADVLVEGPADPIYNCIAWALGYTDRWINPPAGQQAFVDLFLQAQHPRSYGKVLAAGAGTATADGYAANGAMTHGSRLDGLTWSSKLGQYLRITHNRLGVEGVTYGNVTVSFS